MGPVFGTRRMCTDDASCDSESGARSATSTLNADALSNALRAPRPEFEQCFGMSRLYCPPSMRSCGPAVTAMTPESEVPGSSPRGPKKQEWDVRGAVSVSPRAGWDAARDEENVTLVTSPHHLTSNPPPGALPQNHNWYSGKARNLLKDTFGPFLVHKLWRPKPPASPATGAPDRCPTFTSKMPFRIACGRAMKTICSGKTQTGAYTRKY